MSELNGREDWVKFYESRKDHRDEVISHLEDNPWSEGTILRLFDFCFVNVDRLKNRHPTIVAGLKTPLERRFFVLGNTEGSFDVRCELWNKREDKKMGEEIIEVDLQKFTNLLDFFKRNTIQAGSSSGEVPEGKYNIYHKTTGSSNIDMTAIRNVLPMISLGIFELGGKDWLEHTDRDRITVGDSIENYVSFSGPGTSPKPSSNNVSIEEESVQVLEICNLLKLRSNVILEGVPGTGKTWIRNEVKKSMNAKMEVVTFHPASTYEEFVGGIFPISKEDNDGNLLFEYQKGTLSRFANEAIVYAGQDYILFIDEINRANIPLVMGELLTIIESTKRTDPGPGKEALSNGPNSKENNPWEVAVHVEYDDKKSKYLRLPSNLYILATMNTSDRSVVSMDAALRRRFAYYRIETKLTTSGEDEMWSALQGKWWDDKKEIFDKVFKILVEVNQHLQDEIGPDAMLGHSYLFFSDDEVEGLNENEVVSEMMELNILPQIADTLTSMNKTTEDDVVKINKILQKMPNLMLRHELKAPTSGSKSLDIAVTVCERNDEHNEEDNLLLKESEFDNNEIFIMNNDDSGPKIKNIHGYMVKRGSEFIILKGSGSIIPNLKLDGRNDNQQKNIRQIKSNRDKLVEEGKIKDENENYGKFVQDVPFSSLNAASEIVRGTTVTGAKTWKRDSDGVQWGDIH